MSIDSHASSAGWPVRSCATTILGVGVTCAVRVSLRAERSGSANVTSQSVRFFSLEFDLFRASQGRRHR
jgi:hypothetical protein